MQWRTYTAAAIFALALTSCGANSNGKVKSASMDESDKGRDDVSESAVTYNLDKPSSTWTLPQELLEISGNAWIDDNHLLVIEDTHPNLYLVRLDKEAVVEKVIPFAEETGKKFDIEDVALQGTTAYAMWSHGSIYKIANWQTKPSVDSWKTDLKKGNNTEGLCVDPSTNKLLVACKNKSGEEDEKKSTRAVYQFDPATGKLDDQPFLLIEKKDFKKVADEKFDFYPSAIAVHPTTHDIYILSTKDTKGLAQYSHDGKLKGFEFIDKDLMPQPEGLCFSPNGTLYISTEGKHGEPAKIMKFETKNGK